MLNVEGRAPVALSPTLAAGVAVSDGVIGEVVFVELGDGGGLPCAGAD